MTVSERTYSIITTRLRDHEMRPTSTRYRYAVVCEPRSQYSARLP